MGNAPAPWRKHSQDFSWSDSYSEKLKKNIEYTFPDVEPNFLIFGPSGHGKSSFINSLSTISQNRKSNIANSGCKASGHTTSVLRRYNLPGKLDNFWIFDTKGIVVKKENNKNLADNIVSIINGHVRPDTEITTSEFSREGDYWVESPEEKDKVHCVILVVDITVFGKGNMFSAAYKYDVMSVLRRIDYIDVPRIVVLTHADKLNYCIQNMFYNARVEEAVLTASEILGVPIENIHPIVNYSNTEFAGIEPTLHIPILLALESALNFASDTLHKRGM